MRNFHFSNKPLKKIGFYSLSFFSWEIKCNLCWLKYRLSQQLFRNKARTRTPIHNGLPLHSTNTGLPLDKNVPAQSENHEGFSVSEVGGASTTIFQKGFCLLEVQSPAGFWKSLRSWAEARKENTTSSVGPHGPVTPPLWSFHLGRDGPISSHRFLQLYLLYNHRTWLI